MNLVFTEAMKAYPTDRMNGADTVSFFDGGTQSKIHFLQTDSIPMAPTTTYAELAAGECNFPGYAPQFLDWNTTHRDGVGGYELSCDPPEMRPSNDTFGGQTVYGIFATGNGADSHTVLFMGSLDNPIALTDTLSAINLDLTINAPIGGAVVAD